MKDPGPKYHLAMAFFMVERGYENLAQSHIIAAMDCQPGCLCPGCASFRRFEERIVAKRAKVN